MENKTTVIEEMTTVIKNTWLPINRGDTTIGETRLSEYDAFRLANALYDAGHTKQQNKGTWKLHSTGFGTCSVCNFTQASVYDQDTYQRYCGHCGAKMSLEDN